MDHEYIHVHAYIHICTQQVCDAIYMYMYIYVYIYIHVYRVHTQDLSVYMTSAWHQEQLVKVLTLAFKIDAWKHN